MNLKAALEGLLFIAGDDGLSEKQMTEVLEIDKTKLDDLIKKLSEDYIKEDRGLYIEYLGNKLKMVTKKKYVSFYQKLFNTEENNTLTPAALETLAIIAYNEPVTRIMIDEIRGVNSAHLVRKLAFMNFIKEVGRSELPGRPILYGITDEFLDYFGLASTKDLPTVELNEDEIETDLFDSKYKEN